MDSSFLRCLSEMNELSEQYFPMFDRIIVMPLRKLLCESSSVLLKVCPDFKMPPLLGFTAQISDNQTIIRPPFATEPMEKWILVKQWLEQNISWFDRDAASIATMIPKYCYEDIIKKLGGRQYKAIKPQFEALYYSKQVEYKGQVTEVYCKKNPEDVNANQTVHGKLSS